jgi:hypothetical protein
MPICQADAECSAGTVCLAGTCSARPSGASIASCEVLTPAQSTRPGQIIELSALAKRADGRIVPGVEFLWSSTSSDAVAIVGSSAVGGTGGGQARLIATASSAPSVRCGSSPITNYLPPSAGTVRVVVVDGASGLGIDGARVVIESGGIASESITAAGVTELLPSGPVDSVTAMQAGHETISVLEPGTSDLFLVLPRLPDPGLSAGFRGSLDISATSPADVQIGFIGAPLPTTLLDLSRADVFGDPIPTLIDAPELGLNNAQTKLYGGYITGLGIKDFTDDHAEPGGGTRCQGVGPSKGELGCFGVRANGGSSAAWAFGGQLRLSQTTDLGPELVAQGIDFFNYVNSNDNWGIYIPTPHVETGLPIKHFALLGYFNASFNHAVLPLLQLNAVASTASQGEIAVYQVVQPIADTRDEILSIISIPDLPRFAGSTACPDGAVLIVAAILPGRGLIPLGVASGFDTFFGSPLDCRVNARTNPFDRVGEVVALEAGELPLAMAPKHGGLEGSHLVVILLAIKTQALAPPRPVPLSVIVAHPDRIATHQDLTKLSYVPYPTGVLSLSDASVTFGAASSTTTYARVDIESGVGRWQIYTPLKAAKISFPSDSQARATLSGATRAAIELIRTDAAYEQMWSLGSGKTVDRLAEHLAGFAEQECTSGGACDLKQ